MTDERLQEIEELFHRALSLDPKELPAFLDRECAGDPDLRAALENILASDRKTAPLFSEVRAELAATAKDLGNTNLDRLIGPYTLGEKIGEGGFGEVYAADQVKPFKRRVALKILKAGMDTKAVLARFDAERQALAVMDHPGIAKVFDAGETNRGRPYFVMELVMGEPITGYCDKHRLTISDRLDLFESVCQAVQHAHQKGIIHRDLKPSNVLVTLVNDEPVPKVIDFGIAKATKVALTEATLYTEQGQLIGTPEYMSPEQAEVGGLDIDTRTDIYALGVLLYEMLTGALPFDPKTFRNAGIANIQAILREKEPPRPSTRVSTPSEASTAAATKRKTDRHRLARQLRGDLDWIVLKAMEKDRTRRYDTANALAAEIRRYRNDEPVLAGPPSAIYRFSKFAKRNRVALAVSAIVIGSMSYGLIESSRQQAVAEKALIQSEAVTAFLANMLNAVDPDEQGRDVSVRQVLDEAAKSLGAEFDKQPLVRARLLETVGGAYKYLGLFEEARPLLESALAIGELELGNEHPSLGRTVGALASVVSELGDYAESRPMHERALALTEKAYGPEHELVGLNLNNLAAVLVEIGDYDAARPLLERSVVIREKALGPEHRDFAESLNNLARLLKEMGEYDEALLLQQRALAIREKVLGPDHPDLASNLNSLATLYSTMGDYEGSREYQMRALAIWEVSLGPEHPRVAAGLINVGLLLRETGNPADAKPLLERALSILEKSLGKDHPHVAICLINLGSTNRVLSMYGEARSLLERAIAIQEKALGRDHPHVAYSLDDLGLVYSETGDNETARLLHERSLAIRVEALGPDHAETAASFSILAHLLNETGNYREAKSFLERSIGIREKVLGSDNNLVTADLELLSQINLHMGEEVDSIR